jgi:hypothetical protein
MEGTMNKAVRALPVPCKARRFWLAIGLLTVWVRADAPAQGADVTVVRFNGQNIQGELLVATESAVIVKTESSIRNIWWQGDSAFAVLLPFSEVQKIVIEGNSNILLGTGMGLAVGAGFGALTAEKGWAGASAGGGGILGALAGLVVGGLTSHGEKVFDPETRGGFSALPDHARYGTTTPAILKHLK